MAGKNDVSFNQIIADLRNQIYYPIYFLFGDEPYYIDEISDYIETHVLSDQEKEFNQTILYGKDTDIATISGFAKQYPMMANYQVLIIKEAQELKKNIDDLIPYILQPLSSTLLVICFKYDRIDRRKALAKAVEKQGVLFESSRLYDTKVPGWIEEYVKKLDYSITVKAAYMLTEFLGADLSKIVNEIKKLLIIIPEKTAITEDLVEENIGISKDFNVFELQKALGNKDVYKANQIIYYFSANPRENPLAKIIPILYAFFSKVLLYHSLPDKSRNNVAGTLAINPFFVGDYEVTARNYSIRKLTEIVEILRHYDLRSKGVDNVSAAEGELLKEMIYKILH